jgi:hypothetical protein
VAIDTTPTTSVVLVNATTLDGDDGGGQHRKGECVDEHAWPRQRGQNAVNPCGATVTRISGGTSVTISGANPTAVARPQPSRWLECSAGAATK